MPALEAYGYHTSLWRMKGELSPQAKEGSEPLTRQAGPLSKSEIIP